MTKKHWVLIGLGVFVLLLILCCVGACVPSAPGYSTVHHYHHTDSHHTTHQPAKPKPKTPAGRK